MEKERGEFRESKNRAKVYGDFSLFVCRAGSETAQSFSYENMVAGAKTIARQIFTGGRRTGQPPAAIR
jgi:hypothetical protein